MLAQAEDRFVERRRHQRRRVLWRVLAWLGILALAAGSVYLLYFSSVLTLRADQVRVQGQGEYVDSEAVAAVVRTQDGVPLARINAGALRTQILSLPGVKDARIDRSWPHGMTVSITARVVVLANARAAGFQLLDDTATEVAAVREAPAGVTVAKLTEPVAAETVTAVLAVVKALPPELAGQLHGIEAKDQVSITLMLGKVQVRWGDAQNLELKTRVTTMLATTGARVIDVTNPTSPITR